LFFSVFELKSDPRLLDLAKQFYLAHEARYNVTGKLVAFSEGNTGVGDPSFAYEFTVLSNGQTWVIKDPQFSDANIPEVIYYKVALGFLAMYPTTFSRELVSYLDATSPPRTKGYTDGVNENGQIVSTIVDKTNGLIISAARYALENSNYVVSSWRDSDMGAFPWPFIQNGNLNNTTIVIGKNKLNNSGGSAQSTDAIGGILLTQKLTRNSSTGELVAVLDDWSIYGDLASGNVNLIDKETNLIVLGNPRVNSISYFYNCLRDQFGEPMVPVVFVEGLDENNTYLYVPNTGSVYETEFNADGTVAKDYGVIMEFQDQFERYVIMVYGLEAEGTLGTCKFLCDYKNWSYNATALIIQSSGTKLNYYPSDSSVVEVITC
jgi:hypothetical protein